MPGQTIPATVTIPAGGQTIQVKVQHQTSLLNDSKTLTRTITVTKPDGSVTTTPQSVTLTRTGTHDEVTNADQWGAWSTGSWSAYTAPTIDGYTPSQSTVPAQTVNDRTKDQIVNITYIGNLQSGEIVYIDVNNHRQQVGSTPLSGRTGESVTITPEIPNGYILVPGQHIPTTEIATATGIPTVTVEVQPSTNAIHDNKTITRTINVHHPDGSVTTTVQQVTLTRNGTHDVATNTDSWGPWTTGTWDAFNAPVIPGYTAHPASVSSQAVTIKTDNSTVDITYSAENQTLTVNFTDNHGHVVKTVTFSGPTGSTINDLSNRISAQLPADYQLPAEYTLPTSYTFDAAANQTLNVPVVAAHKRTYDTQTITRRIVENLPGQSPRVINQTATLQRPVDTNLVTGEVTYGNWSTDTWPAFTPDAVPGYRVDPTYISAETVTDGTHDTSVVVKYVEQTTNVSDTKTVTETVHYRYRDGRQAAPDKVQTVTFTRQGLRHADGTTTWQDWQPTGDQTLPAVVSPTINGYHPDQARIVAQTVNSSSDDRTFTVYYDANSTPVNPDDHGHHDNPTPVNPDDHGHHDNPTPVNPDDHGHHDNPTPINPNDHGNGNNTPNQPSADNHASSGNIVVPKAENAQSDFINYSGQSNETTGQSQRRRLPQTGNQKNNDAIFGLVVIAMAAMLGLGGYRKQR